MPDDYVRHLFYPDNKNRKYTIFLFFRTFIYRKEKKSLYLLTI